MTDHLSDIDAFACMRQSPLSEGLTDDQLQALTAITFCRRLADHEVLIEEGKIDNSLHIVTEGALAVTRDLGKGDFTTIHVLRTPCWSRSPTWCIRSCATSYVRPTTYCDA